MATPPTFVAESESSFVVNTTPKTQGLSVTAGDPITVVGLAANNLTTLGTPADGVNTYTLTNSIVITDFCTAYIWKATAATTASLTISITRGGAGGDHWGFNAFTDSGSAGHGASTKTNTTGAPSLALTTTADNSAVYVLIGDWNALATARTWRTVNSITPTSGNGHEKTYVQDGANYTVYMARYPDTGVAGANTYGLTAPTGEKYSIVALEVKGQASGTDVSSPDTPGWMRLGESPSDTTIAYAIPDAPGGFRLGGNSTTSAAVGIVTPDVPSGLRLGGDTGATVSVGIAVSDVPGALRLGGSSNTSTASSVTSTDTPSGFRLGQSPGSVTSAVVASDVPGWLRLGESPAFGNSVTLAADSAPGWLRLGGDSASSSTFGITVTDVPSGFRLGGPSASAPAVSVVVADAPSGLRLGESPANGSSVTLATDERLGWMRLGGDSITSESFGVTATDSPSGFRLGGNSNVAEAVGIRVTDLPSGFRLGQSPANGSENTPVDVSAADRPGWFRLGASPGTATVGLPDAPEADIIVSVGIPLVITMVYRTMAEVTVGPGTLEAEVKVVDP